MLVVEEGSLYPALYRIEAKGWIQANWGKSENNWRAKYYELTRAGRRQREEETAIWGARSPCHHTSPADGLKAVQP